MNKIFITLTVLLGLAPKLSAQGGWDIGYIPADSITENHIGMKVLPDFLVNSELSERITKRLKGKTPNPILFIRSQDSTYLTINNKRYLIKEVRRIGVDYGYMKQQTVELTNSERQTMSIKEMTITNYQNKALELEINLPEFSAKFWIGISLLDGLMHEIE